MSGLVERMSDGLFRKAKNKHNLFPSNIILCQYCRFVSLIQVIDLPRRVLAADHTLIQVLSYCFEPSPCPPPHLLCDSIYETCPE